MNTLSNRNIGHYPNIPASWEKDEGLRKFLSSIEKFRKRIDEVEQSIAGQYGSLEEFARWHEFLGLHIENGQWVFREYAPHAEYIILAGDFSNWNNDERFRL